MKKPHHTARAGLTNNTICTDTVKFDRKAVKAQLLQDFNVEHPFWKDNPDDYQFAPHQRSYVERGVVTDFFKEYEDLLNVQRI
jgi:alpha-D-ribose 1-methylphosphonate 5-triphosphate synthase subunit PhnL